MKRTKVTRPKIIWSAAAVCAVLVLSLVPAVQARTPAAYAAPLISHAAARAADLKVRWQTPIGLSRGKHDRVVNLWHVGSLVYVVTSRGYLVAINASSGTIRWTRQIHGLKATISRPAISGPHQVVILSSTTAYYVNSRTGADQTKAELPFPPGTHPVLIPASRLLVGSLNEGFDALSAVPPFFTEWSEDSPGDSFTSTPVVAAGTVIFGSRLGYLWGREPATGNHGWKRKLGGAITAPITSGDSLVFVPCRDNNLYAVDAQSGVSPWVTHLPGRLIHRAAVSGKILLVCSAGKGLYALNAATGKILWGPVAGITRIAARKRNTLYAVTAGGNLKMLNAASGRVIDGVRLNGARFFIYNSASPVVFIASRAGRVAAIAPRRQW